MYYLAKFERRNNKGYETSAWLGAGSGLGASAGIGYGTNRLVQSGLNKTAETINNSNLVEENLQQAENKTNDAFSKAEKYRKRGLARLRMIRSKDFPNAENFINSDLYPKIRTGLEIGSNKAREELQEIKKQASDTKRGIGGSIRKPIISQGKEAVIEAGEDAIDAGKRRGLYYLDESQNVVNEYKKIGQDYLDKGYTIGKDGSRKYLDRAKQESKEGFEKVRGAVNTQKENFVSKLKNNSKTTGRLSGLVVGGAVAAPLMITGALGGMGLNYYRNKWSNNK